MGKVFETKFYKGTRIYHARKVGKVNGPVVDRIYVDEVAEPATPEQEEITQQTVRRARRSEVRFYTN